MKYQIVILDAIGNYASILRGTLNSRVKELNLEPANILEFLNPSNLQHLTVGTPKVGVLFSDGENGKKFTAQVDILLNNSAAVIPVVSSVYCLADACDKACSGEAMVLQGELSHETRRR